MTTLNELVATWRHFKEIEQHTTERRRQIEDAIVALLEVPDSLDGTKTIEVDEDLTLKIVGRLDRKVDGDKAQEIAAEHGLQEHLSALFRWKPELNLTAWKNAAENITKPFAAAVTTKPGRPSFAVVVNKKEK